MKYVLIGLLAIVSADIYIWAVYIRKRRTVWKVLHWIPLAVLLLAVAVNLMEMQWWTVTVLTALLLGFFIPECVFALFSMTGKLLGKFWKPAAGAGFLIGTAAGFAMMATTVYGLTEGWRHVIVKNTEIGFGSLPESFDGYRIVQLSDLHLGTFENSPATVRKIVSRVNALEPDLILFTGDMVNMSPDELAPFMKEISALKARDGTYSVLGNHDYCGYAHYASEDGQKKAVLRLMDMERKCGMDLLMNENRILRNGQDSIALIGVENDGIPPFPERGDLTKAQNGLHEGIFKILMSHDPTHWRRKVLPQTDIDLTLSGHTHAMQIRIGKFSPSQFIYKEWGGLYRNGERALYVSTGTGGNIAFRIGAWPEIDVITLKKSSPNSF